MSDISCTKHRSLSESSASSEEMELRGDAGKTFLAVGVGAVGGIERTPLAGGW